MTSTLLLDAVLILLFENRCPRGPWFGYIQHGDVFILTADHGNDPTNGTHTDHTREFVPLLVYGDGVRRGVSLGTRSTFADIGATIADAFGVDHDGAGSSFLGELLSDPADR